MRAGRGIGRGRIISNTVLIHYGVAARIARSLARGEAHLHGLGPIKKRSSKGVDIGIIYSPLNCHDHSNTFFGHAGDMSVWCRWPKGSTDSRGVPWWWSPPLPDTRIPCADPPAIAPALDRHTARRLQLTTFIHYLLIIRVPLPKPSAATLALLCPCSSTRLLAP